MSKLIIEVRLNEFSSKARNANIPYSPAEIVQSALDAHDEGASIAHFHARTEDGGEAHQSEIFADIVSGIRARSEILVYPTLGRFEHGADPLLRLSNIETLSASSLKPDIAPLDLGSMNCDIWDPVGNKFLVDHVIYQNSARDLRMMARRLRELGVKPQLVLWGLSGVRLMNALIAAGELDTPAYAAFLLTDESMLFGHPATSAGLRAFIDTLAGADVQWSVMINGTNFFPLLPEIVEAGGHVSIGLGDYPYPELGAPTNADLVRSVVDYARGAGREIASAAEVRNLLAITGGKVLT